MRDKQAIIYGLLTSGEKWTVIDLAIKGKIGDPRSVIRNLRKQGIEVKDEWVHGRNSSFKRYWIEPGQPEPEKGGKR